LTKRNKEDGSKQFFCLVRHSQRADDPTMPWELKKKQEEVIIECDPQLSRPNGKEHAKQTGEFLAGVLEEDLGVGPLEEAEVFIFSSPFLACVESAAAIAKSFGVGTINVQDQLSDSLMKAWYADDPLNQLMVKLTTNREPFTAFLKAQYNIASLDLEYKRAANLVIFPETVD
jgi:hypothetical protein